MSLSDEEIDEWIALYGEERRETLTREQAREMMRRVLTLFQVLARPLPGEDESSGAAPPPAQPS